MMLIGKTISARELEIPIAVEISRSGNGAHLWIFFAGAIPARTARQLGTALISHTCTRTRQLKLTSYDRLFPNQDTLPNGGFGNLIALPLQKRRREHGASVFVDYDLHPYCDQWDFLSRLHVMDAHAIETALSRTIHDANFGFIEKAGKLSGPLPATLKMVIAGQLYIDKTSLTPPLSNSLIRLATFTNPEFHRAQKLRLPVWNKPRLISCAEQFPQHLTLPRGCLDAILELLCEHNIACQLQDERHNGTPLDLVFNGTLRADQETAVAEM